MIFTCQYFLYSFILFSNLEYFHFYFHFLYKNYTLLYLFSNASSVAHRLSLGYSCSRSKMFPFVLQLPELLLLLLLLRKIAVTIADTV